MFRKIYFYIRFRIHNERIKPAWAKDPNIHTIKAPKDSYTWEPLWYRFSRKYDADEALRQARLREARANVRAARKAKKELKKELRKERRNGQTCV